MRSPTLLAVAILLLPVPVIAGVPGPVCRTPTVLDEMARQLRETTAYLHLDPGWIQEQPTSNPRVVRCTLSAEVLSYNTPLNGMCPIGRCERHVFDVEIVRNGFVVHVVR